MFYMNYSRTSGPSRPSVSVVLLTGVGHDAQVPLLVVVQQLIHVEHRILLVGDIEPRRHDGGPGQNHPPPLLLRPVLRLKHVLHRFPDHRLRQQRVADAGRSWTNHRELL